MHGGNQATLEQVAALAGVSRATVSRVINGNPRVSEGTRTAVERAVSQLSYRPNRAARSLVTRRTYSVALVVTEPNTKFFNDPFFARLVHGATQTLASTDYQLVLFTPPAPGSRERLDDYLTAGHVDGALLTSLHGDDPLPWRLHDAGIPTVIGGRAPRGLPISSVDADNRGGARTAVRHLVELGRRRIATVTGPRDMPAGLDRLEGYRDALAEAELAASTDLIVEGDFTREGGAEATARLLDRRTDVDALFAASDLAALGALRSLHAAGIRVPDDVALVGFDDSELAPSAEPPLTTVHQPIEELGRQATALLLGALDDPDYEPEHIVLDTELVRRDSA
ncbi:LacI family transcriptional regulator [Egibacter rhizosphaerae]|uniref:LacI family transcriptional regulator n=1 Tax=Egibacter rhizosphaerae TaxID=1670831 RepID=A0A411YA67_9ACTN|nr:LacI family DNA-binding transcriptional regulator [Egibacter rhizosphaerae]QBI18113.1 LacI family transcriptional regulator [Egibacter rhizosphaerae]